MQKYCGGFLSIGILLGAALALSALLIFAIPTKAQTYKDNGGTTILGVVPLGGCVAGGTCVGPTGTGSTVFSGQQSCTTSAVALPSQGLANGIVVTALSSNSSTVYVGGASVTTSTGYPLAAGQSISYALANVSSIYVICSAASGGVAFTGN